jgi:hypothetical protein
MPIDSRVLLINCFQAPNPRENPHKWLLLFEDEETFSEPIPYTGQPSYFDIDNEVARQLSPRYAFSFPK